MRHEAAIQQLVGVVTTGAKLIKPQEAEIEEAKWFKVLQLPKLPSKISIARRLIDAVCQELVG